MSHDRDDDLIGKIQEKTGWLTGDREVEAEGKMRRLRAAQGTDDTDGEEGGEALVDAAERDLRQDYGEYDPDVDGRTPAPDVRPVDE